ncbi:TPA: filamentous hemagglutinin N-terminal domain-containing protein [Salmonella enterica subsp. enterica serovar Java]
MNKIYKLKYDRRRNQLVAVSELTTGAGKEATGSVAGECGLQGVSTFRRLLGTLTPLAVLTGLVIGMLPGLALANPDLPVGGQVVAGQGSISTSGNQMTIHQGTHGLVTNWNSFDIGQNHTVQFVQPDSSAVALNRVTGGHESQILGTLTANGQVMLVNPAGVMFGKGARVNTAGLLASTKNISTEDFMAGRYTFSGGSHPGAEIVNQGSLTTTKGGYIVLAADRVRNSGTLSTPSGKTVLAAADRVTLQLDNTGLASVSVNGSVVNALVENSGLIAATNGQVYLTARGKEMLLNTVVNNSGTVEARGLNQRGGEIVLDGGESGVVSQSGMLLADSETGRGGKITVQGTNIHLACGSRTSATGRTGGGGVYVGGGWQGKDVAIRNASKVVMDRDGVIDVSATEKGDGGKAVLWSEDYTNFRGRILAKGGAQSGNGGQVETSSHHNLQAFGDVEASALNGRGGNWLLDPTDVTIVAGADKNVSNDSNVFTPSDNGAQIGVGSIQSQLNNGANVTIKTSGHDTDGQRGNITFAKDAKIKKTGGTDATLTLKADGNITFADRKWSGLTDTTNGAITSTSGKLNLNLLAGNDGQNSSVTISKFVHFFLNDGDFSVGPANESGGVTSLLFTNAGLIDAGNISLNTAGGTNGNFYTLNATNNLTVNGPLSASSGYGVNSELKAGNVVNITTASGNMQFSATDTENGGGGILINGQNGVNIRTDEGSLVMQVAGNNNKISVTSGNGSVNLSGKVQSELNSGHTGLTLTGVKISSKDSVTLNGTTFWGKGAILSGLNVSAGGDVNISGTAQRLSDGLTGSADNTEGLTITGSKITSDNGNISVSGLAASRKNASLKMNTTDITASTGKILLAGKSEGGNGASGVNVKGSNLSANSLEIKGVSTKQGTGFSLTDSHLNGNLTDLTNVTFSSAGSAPGVTNNLDSNIVTADNRDTMLAKHPENLTRIDMGGTSIFDDTALSTKGWTADYTSAEKPYGGWIFGNTTVTAAGLVDLKGVGFTDATITVSDGDFSIANKGRLTLKNTTLNVTKGNVNLTADAGVTLSGSNVTAGKDIRVYGETALGDGVSLDNSALSATAGDINITGISHGIGTSGFTSGISLGGETSFHSLSNYLNGTHTSTYSYSNSGGIVVQPGNISFTGDTTVNATGHAFAGLIFNLPSNDINVSFSGGTAVVNGMLKGRSGGDWSGGVTLYPWYKPALSKVNIKVTDAVLDITGSASNTNGISSLTEGGAPGSGDRQGFVFSGDGDVSIKGISDTHAGLQLRFFNNTDLTGNFTVIGESNSGPGVLVDENANISLHNATVTGSSQTGTGVLINAWMANRNPVVNLNGNTLNGTSGTGTGISINGNNVTITNGSLNGTSGGSGAGIQLFGASHYTVDGVTVSGQSQAGSGISVRGDLSASNTTVNGTTATGSGVNIGGNLTSSNTSVSGTASGNGSGVLLNGNVTGDVTEKNVIIGHSAEGDGLLVSGESTATRVTLNGDTVDGNGIKVTGNLTTDNVVASGNATGGGNGLNLAGNVSGGRWTGDAANGTGVNVTGDSTLTDVSLSGTTESGTGVNVRGNLTNAGSTTVNGSASGNGTGATVGGSLNGDIDGSSASGAGAVVNGMVNGTVNGTSTSGTGAAVNGTINGMVHGISGSGTGATVNGMVNGMVDGTSTSGTGAVVGDGADITQGSQVNGRSGTGTGSVTEGNVTNQGSISGQSGEGTGTALGGNLSGNGLVTGSTIGPGDGVNLSGNVSGGTVTGNAVHGTGVNVSGNSTLTNVALSGTTGSGTGVNVAGNLTNTGSTTVNGSATDNGTGLHVRAGIDIAGGYLRGRAVSGPAVVIDGGNTLVNTTVSGNSGSNSGLLVKGVVVNLNSLLKGRSESGDGVSLNGTVTGGSLSGQSENGAGVHVTGNSTLSGVNMSASSGGGQGLQLDGVLSTAGVTTLNGVAQRDSSAERRQVYELQNRLSHNNRSLKQVVTASGYREQEKPVVVGVCTDGEGASPCHHLDAGMRDRPSRP